MKKLTIAVMFGGKSSEYPVSLHSSASVLTQIDRNKYDVIMIGITKDGEWYHYQGSIEEIEQDVWWKNPDNKHTMLSCSTAYPGFLIQQENQHWEHLAVDCIFPVLHGKNGEDGTLQGLLELSGIPYVGCDTLSSSICMDKEMTHIICENAGIPCAPYMAVYQQDVKDYKALFEEAKEKLHLPFFIKPCNAGSSFGIHKIKDFAGFEEALQDAFYHDGRGKVIFETTIEGFEIGCAVMGNEEIFVGSVDEIETTQDFFDYEGKYEMVNSKIHCPARISKPLFEQARAMAKRIYRAMNCSGFTRVDMFVTPQDTIVFNEVNTIPGFTAHSRYPAMMKEVGISFPELIDQLIILALKRKK